MPRTNSVLGWALVLAAPCCTAVTESEMPLDRSFRVDVTVEDQPRGRFLFDTGFTVTTIGSAAADHWGLAAVDGPSIKATDAHGIVRSVDRYVHVPGLTVGATRFAAYNAPVISFPPELDVDGVLGTNAMQPLAWIVDVPGGRLHVVNGSNLERRLAELYPGRTWTAVPLLDTGGSWSVPVELAGNERRRATLRLDTGADSTSLPAALVAELRLPDGTAERRRQDELEAEALRRALEAKGLKVESVRVSVGTGSTSLWGKADSRWFLLAGLQLGRTSCESLTVHDSGNQPGLLGADVLARIVWALDGPGSRLLIRDP